MGLYARGRRSWIAVCVVVCIALFAAACGNDDDPASASPEVTGTDDAPETTDTPTTEANSGDGGSGLAELEEAARAEGQLTIYISQGTDVVDATIAAFNEEYPEINVEYIRLATGPLANRFASEAEAGVNEADLLNVAAPDLLDEHPELFQELDSTLIPELADWPEEFFKGHYVETGISAHIVAYNTNAVDPSDLPTSWDGFLSPEWQGRAIVLDPRSTPTYMSFFHVMAEEFGEDFLTEFGEQGFTWVDSGGSASQQVAAGAYDVAFPVVLAHNVDLRADGAPLAIHEIAPVHGFPHLFALPVEQRNPNAARLFLNWLLTPAGQAANCFEVYAPIIPLEGSSCPPLSDDHVSAAFNLEENRQRQILDALGLG